MPTQIWNIEQEKDRGEDKVGGKPAKPFNWWAPGEAQ